MNQLYFRSNDGTKVSTSVCTDLSFREPQFVFGLILVFSWLIFMGFALYHSEGDQALIASLFVVALGFAWGHYFRTRNSQQFNARLMSRICELEEKLVPS